MTNLLPKLTLFSPDGASAEIYHHGAHVASWRPAGGGEHLFLSPASEFRPGAPIRGGVPVIFPQFSGLGDLPKHGFARLMAWQASAVETGPDFAAVSFRLSDDEITRQRWPHAFQLAMRVQISGPRIRMTLAVANTGVDVFTFTAALHTYFDVADVSTASVDGLAGVRFHDTTVKPWDEHVQGDAKVNFLGQVDRIYYDVPRRLALRTPERVLHIEASGFPDAVVWNPGPEKCAALPDMLPDSYRHFVCVEAAVIGQPVSLAPGENWQGTQELIAE